MERFPEGGPSMSRLPAKQLGYCEARLAAGGVKLR